MAPHPTPEEFDILCTLLPKGVKWGQSLTPAIVAGIAAKLEAKLRANPVTEPQTLNDDRRLSAKENVAKQAFPEGVFEVYKQDPDAEHSAWLVRWPGGGMIEFNHHADSAVDRLRAEWVALKLNQALTGGASLGSLIPTQDPKYSIHEGRIVNAQNGLPIPMDEPVFIFRARDHHAVPVLMNYMERISEPGHVIAVGNRIDDFNTFAQTHPTRMKEPDTMRGL